ncbi:Filamin-C [Armadillidium nasatum]|uniref:Filamin-C n=1 Tax=Armadillidium nasatum TaxID=96803 RepID=A0A5N5TE25_9CRUS|nr:Filamin-C [Armadillidium nasatum]
MPSNHITSSGPTSYFSSYRESREDRLSSPKEESSQGKINSSFIDSWEKSRFEKRDYTHNSTTSVNDLLRNRSEGISENNEFNNQKSINLSAKDITITGPSIRLVSVGEYAEIVLTSNEKLKKKDVNITVTGPGRRNIPVTIEEENDDLLITFKPLLVGEYNVHIKRGDHHAPGSPFKCYVYNAEEIKVGKIPDGVVGQPVEFEIDGSAAGSGNLEILVNGGHVTSNVRNLGQQKFWASFVPHTPMMHSVEMKFNDATVPG